MSHPISPNPNLHRFYSYISQPVLAPMLDNSSTGYAIMGATIAHMGLVLAGLPSWQCPFLHGAGIPCPGCGLSRSISALAHGDLQQSITYHALAPFFLLGLTLIGFITILPKTKREKALSYLRQAEQRTGFVAIFLIVLVIYWLVRLLFWRESYINLMLG